MWQIREEILQGIEHLVQQAPGGCKREFQAYRVALLEKKHLGVVSSFFWGGEVEPDRLGGNFVATKEVDSAEAMLTKRQKEAEKVHWAMRFQ